MWLRTKPTVKIRPKTQKEGVFGRIFDFYRGGIYTQIKMIRQALFLWLALYAGAAAVKDQILPAAGIGVPVFFYDPSGIGASGIMEIFDSVFSV